MILNNLFRRYFSTEYLARYGSLATYYPEYAASAHATAGYISNGYFEVASPRSLTALPYDAASQFNRYFDAEKVDCKYNPNSESPKTEFPQQPNPHAGQPGQHPNSGKDNNNAPNSTVPGSGLEVVKTEPSFATQGLATGHPNDEDVVVELQQFVNAAADATSSNVATTTTAASAVIPTLPTQIMLVCELVVKKRYQTPHVVAIKMPQKSRLKNLYLLLWKLENLTLNSLFFFTLLCILHNFATFAFSNH